MRLISRSYYIEPMQSTQTTWLSLDSWLPAHFRQTEDHWQAVQARVLTLLLLLYIACFIPVGIIAGLSALYGVPNTGELSLIALLGSGAASACLTHFRITANLATASRFYASMVLLAMLAVIWHTGGWDSPICVYLLTLPVIAGFAMSQKARLVYALLVWLLYSALFALHRYHFPFVQLIAQNYLQHAYILSWALALFSIAACLTLFDISENHLSAMLAVDRAELERRASVDSLTGTLNDQTLFEQIAAEAASLTPDHMQHLVYIIVDNYEEIAQFFGHKIADTFIVHTVSDLNKRLPGGAVLGRVAVNEFVIHAPAHISGIQCGNLLRKLQAFNRRAVELTDGYRFHPGIRFGLFACVDHRLSPQTLAEHAKACVPERIEGSPDDTFAYEDREFVYAT